MQTKTLASIDIGTNTLRLLIAEAEGGNGQDNYHLRELFSDRVITRLGEGLQETGSLSRSARERSIKALEMFRTHISRYPVYRTSAVATSALREAANSSDFLQEVKKTTGFEIEILSGEREAEITASGMLIDMRKPPSTFMIDIGGGSTELIFHKDAQTDFRKSLHLGVVYLAGKYMKHDPPLKEDLASLQQEISHCVASVAASFENVFSEDTIMIGTAGTVTTLAAVAQNLATFDHQRVHNYTLSLETVKNIFHKIATIPSRERAAYVPFEPERLDILVPGTLILLTLMQKFSFHRLTVSNHGLREGVLIRLYQSLAP